MDLVGHADPYAVLHVCTPDGRQATRYRTAVVYNTNAPTWDEELVLRNVPLGTRCTFQVWDKDQLTADDAVGSCSLILDAETAAAAAAGPGRSGGSVPATTSTCAVPSPSPGPSPGPGQLNGFGVLHSAAVAAVASVFSRPSRFVGCVSAAAAACAAPLTPGAAPVLTRMSTTGSAVGGAVVRLPIRAQHSSTQGAGVLVLELRCRPASGPEGPMMHCGPVRYRVSVSALAGALTRHTQDDGWMLYAAYKLNLAGMPHFFPQGASVHWNTSYDNARQVFLNPAMVGAVKAQHAVLYKDDGEQRRRGLLRGGGDLVALLRGGVRDRQRRYFTYCVLEDGSWRFSETGAAFFADFMSKHAMHACCADHVVYAGEFCLVPPTQPPVRHAASARAPPPPLPPSSTSRSNLAAGSTPLPQLPRSARIPSASALSGPAAPADPAGSRAGSNSAPVTRSPSGGLAITAAEATTEAAAALAALAGVHDCEARGWQLVVDNNSGTYAPPGEQLPRLQELLAHNFPGLQVEVLDVKDPRLEAYHARIPSRVAAK